MTIELTIEQTIEDLANTEAALKILYETRDRLRADLWSYMDKNNAKVIRTNKYKAVIPTKRQYDTGKFKSLFGELDLISKDLFDKIYKPEREELKDIPAKINGTAAKELWEHGDEITDRLQECLLPQRPEIKITELGEGKR